MDPPSRIKHRDEGTLMSMITHTYIIPKPASILVGETFGAFALSQGEDKSGYSLHSTLYWRNFLKQSDKRKQLGE